MSKENIHTIPEIDWKRADLLIALALEEDLDEAGDTTTLAVVPEKAVSRAVLRCKQPGMVVSGLAVAERVFKTVEPALEFNAFVKDTTSETSVVDATQLKTATAEAIPESNL